MRTWHDFIKAATVSPSSRPQYRTAPNRSIYSDRGNWYTSDIKDGSKNYIYLRRKNVPNLAVGTPGRRSIDNVRHLVGDMFKSNLVGKDGTIVGVTPHQALVEIISHNNMDANGGRRAGLMSGIVGPVTRWIGERLTNETDPTAFTDMRRLPSASKDGWKAYLRSIPSRAVHMINYLSVLGDEKAKSTFAKARKLLSGNKV